MKEGMLMTWNFRRSIKVAPGVKLNVSKKGSSLSIGPKGAKLNVNSKGEIHRTVSIPGTGLYNREKINITSNNSAPKKIKQEKESVTQKMKNDTIPVPPTPDNNSTKKRNPIPGFRNDVLWHKVVASLYYLFSLIMLGGGLPLVFFLLSIPFFIFYGIDYFKTKNKQSLVVTAVSLLIFLACPFFMNSANILMNATVETHQLGDKQYATISVEKTNLNTITLEDYQEFLQERVSGQDYDRFSIICDDGTGIVFASCDPTLATYGTVSDSGEIITGSKNICVTSELDAKPLTVELTSIIPKYETLVDNLQKPTQKVSTDDYIKQFNTFCNEYDTWAKEFTSYAPSLLSVAEQNENRDQQLTAYKNELQELSTDILNNYPEDKLAQQNLQTIIHDEIYYDTKLICDHIDYFLSNPEMNGKEYASNACALLISQELPTAIKVAQNEATNTVQKIQAEKEAAEAEKIAAASAQNNNKTSNASYIGNSNTHKFHYPYCSSVKEIKSNHIVNFNNREQAVNNGYVPCKRCNP